MISEPMVTPIPDGTAKEYAQLYREQGFSIIPIPYKSKAARIKWEEFQKRHATEEEIEQWFTDNNTNLAIVCGQVSGSESRFYLTVLDCESMGKYMELKPTIEKNLGIDDLEKHTPVTKTAKGRHIYFYVIDPVASKKFPNLEIRSEGNYVLAPPSLHPTGAQYEWINRSVKEPFIISNLKDIGIDISQKPELSRGSQPMWISQALQHGVSEGERNDIAIRLAGYLKNKHPQDVTLSILSSWNAKNKPPLEDRELRQVIESAYKYPVVNNKYNIKREDFSAENGFSLKSGQVSGQVVDKLRDYGELSEPFDKFLRENPEPHWKRDVAEAIGTTYKDPAFIKLVQRRAGKEAQIKISHGGDKIQWVNKDWQRSKILFEAGKREFLGLSLPFGAEKYIATPEHSQIVVAGDVGSGKTHYGYYLADLNVGKIQIRHFVNEIGDSKAIRNLDDFPRLVEFFGKGYDLVNQDKEQLDVAENIDPNGLNIYDYLHLSWTKEWFLLLQKELSRLSQKLETGVIVVMLQKKRGIGLAMGGDSTRMQCETYVSLNIEKDVRGSENEHGYKIGRVDIVKCKDWASNVNPEVLSCRYRTAPKHGKLIPYDEGWFDRNQ